MPIANIVSSQRRGPHHSIKRESQMDLNNNLLLDFMFASYVSDFSHRNVNWPDDTFAFHGVVGHEAEQRLRCLCVGVGGVWRNDFIYSGYIQAYCWL